MKSKQRCLTRAALLLALTLAIQSLRLLIPLPPFATTFLIGSLINACLLVALEKVGLGSASLIGVIVPLSAYFQQMLPLPIFILPVAAGNLIYLFLLQGGRKFPVSLRLLAAAAGKGVFLYSFFYWLLLQVHLPAQLASAMLFLMGWPQVATALIGAMLGLYLVQRLRDI